MGRFYVEFDPPGYKYCSEPGIDFLIDGPGLAEKLSVDNEAPEVIQDAKFWQPEGSEWILCRPRQFDPDFYRDSRLSDHVLRASRWNFASGITPTEWEQTRIPGETYAANQWINLHVPDSVSSLDSRDYGLMSLVAGLNLPAGLVTVGNCSQTPGGEIFAADGPSFSQLTPFVQWFHYPSPQDVLVFGFGQVAVVCHGDTVWVLRSDTPEGHAWQLLDKFPLGNAPAPEPSAGRRGASASVLQAQSGRTEIRSILAAAVGFTDLFLVPSGGKEKGFPLRRPPDLSGEEVPEPLLKAGPFWIAAMPGQTLSFQVQLVGFEEADSRDEPTPAVWIDLTEDYKPSVTPGFEADALIYQAVGGAGNTTSIEGDGSVRIEDADTEQVIQYGLLDEDGDAWDFGAGETYKGSLYLALTPGWRAGQPGAYLSPQARHLGFRFPLVLADRECVPLVLDDTQFGPLEAETFRRDPEGKRVRITLFDAGLAVLSATGHDQRANYPVHILEDTDNDGVGDQIRVAGWIRKFDVKVLHVRDPDTNEPIQLYRIECEGLLSRAKQKWLYLPQLINPDTPGIVEHTFAVGETVHGAGFDIEDPTVYFAQEDPQAGTAIAQLPGTWKLAPGVLGRSLNQDGHPNEWGPRWSDTRLSYALEVGDRLRGWVLYEDLAGLIWYHDDLQRELQRGAEYVVSAELYATQAEAIAAGAPEQIFLANFSRGNREPLANIIRVSGIDDSVAITPQVVERDRRSITEPDYAHFLGEPVVRGYEPRQAVDLGTTQVICRLLMEKFGRRTHLRELVTEISPWDTAPDPFDVAHVLRADGADYLADHVHWELVRSHPIASLVRTTVTLETLPGGASAGSGPGPYPGRAA